MGKEEIARNEQFLLFPQCFLLNQKIKSSFVDIFDIIYLFAAELEEPKIGVRGKWLKRTVMRRRKITMMMMMLLIMKTGDDDDDDKIHFSPFSFHCLENDHVGKAASGLGRILCEKLVKET